MSVGAIGGYGGINPYEAYEERFAGQISAEDAAELADAIDFDDQLNPAQNAAGIQAIEENRDMPVRIEPADESGRATSDYMRGEMSHVMDDLMEIQGTLWGFAVRPVIPMVGQVQTP